MVLSPPIIGRALSLIWTANCILAFYIGIQQVWIPYMSADGDGYKHINSAPFDGTVMPIAYIPDWTKTANQDKSKRFEDISISEFLPIPLYDAISLLDERSGSKSSTLLRYTYPVTYMGNYRLDYKEFVGGHPAVDIRAPIGTPVLSVANGVVIRISQGDSTGNKFVVIRHSGVPYAGKTTTLYSSYLHLSEVLAKEGDIVKKGTMIGRVGITGITTTPHLHFQIDTEDSPFHPYWHFSSSESRSAGVGFFDAVNIGLNKERAAKYTIHPMNFVNMYLGGYSPRIPDATISVNTGTPEKVVIAGKKEEGVRVIASFGSFDACIGKRFSDVGEKSSFGKSLYPLVDKLCLFSERTGSFGPKESISYREALINTMRYFGKSPTSGNSHFLDIPLGDVLQGYALVAYRDGILEGNYAHPDRIMTREDIAELIVRVARAQKNPSAIKIYSDVDPMNPKYSYIQDYGFLVRDGGGKFYPKTIVSRGTFIQMLSPIASQGVSEE